ncbi:redox-regulated ATPase YchF [Patescibacteria group bacterium]|nr:redox-regulated ATPase YchF [Patescibacteria group bacterium]MBU1684497.1 redox-regulated ATPase YchF [Patescibacteria group bacterium]MBU1987324.1 redox-regulated ATPase YchF [Patescibacteria group bacterium]
MSLSIGIVGLPNVGKSTLFNALTKKQVAVENYPFCTIDPNVGIVEVPDERLNKLARVSKPAKIIPTTIKFIDIAGLVKGAHKGEGLGNQFLAHIRECDAICEVVRDFQDNNIIHVDGKIDPDGDVETINLELIFSDLNTVEKRLSKAEKNARTGDKKLIEYKNLLQKIKQNLEKGTSARAIELNADEKKQIYDLNLITIKPIIYILNVSELNEQKKLQNNKTIQIDVKLEQEISALPENEQKEYIKELGLVQSGLDKLIQTCYELLDLITFFTTGTDETRAWTVNNRAIAPQAAGVIHTDFEKSFIRAEIINWEKFIKADGEQKAREQGLIRTEGKDYVMQDGDVCNFLCKQ